MLRTLPCARPAATATWRARRCTCTYPEHSQSAHPLLQACSHCHVESSPLRTEAMDRATAVRCLELMEDALEDGLHTLDITGGAPELSPCSAPTLGSCN